VPAAGAPIVGASEPALPLAASGAAGRGFAGVWRRGRGGAGTAAGAGSIAGSAGSAFTSTGSGWAATVAGVSATSGVGASTSIELPTIATLLGRVSGGGGGGGGAGWPYQLATIGTASSAACNPTEARNAVTSPPVDGFTAALIS
jgi:hypothetical protein